MRCRRPDRGSHISAQGEATRGLRGLRALPTPWGRVHIRTGSPERAEQQRQNNRNLTSVLRPFRASLDLFSSPRAALRRHGDSACPGLICSGPFGAEMRSFRKSKIPKELVVLAGVEVALSN